METQSLEVLSCTDSRFKDKCFLLIILCGASGVLCKYFGMERGRIRFSFHTGCHCLKVESQCWPRNLILFIGCTVLCVTWHRVEIIMSERISSRGKEKQKIELKHKVKFFHENVKDSLVPVACFWHEDLAHG